MKIERMHLNNLRNDEHFQFNTEFRDAINRFGANNLNIESQYDVFLTLYDQEDIALKKIMKSAITVEIQTADKRRDQTYRGMADVLKAALNHFNFSVREAAKRLKIVFDTYGNLAKKPLNEQTSGIYNILQDLNGKYYSDASEVGIIEWMNELQAANEEFDNLMKSRYEESAMKTDLVLKQVRLQIDSAFRDIAERIAALVIIEGADNYVEFIKYINVVIVKYMTIVAQRAGRKKAIAN